MAATLFSQEKQQITRLLKCSKNEWIASYLISSGKDIGHLTTIYFDPAVEQWPTYQLLNERVLGRI